ncbi:MAG: hypothetical protein V1754_09400 [Pseudomonadota bacterium]
MQISFTCGEPDDGSEYCWFGVLTRDGEPVSGDWLTYNYNSDLGSGISGRIDNGTFCDCRVPTGQHEYGLEGQGWATITVVEVGSSADGTFCADAMICMDSCKEAPVQDAGIQPLDAGIQPLGGEPTSETSGKLDEVGCTMTGTRSFNLLNMLVLVGLFGLLRARRR